ncbi:MAG: hypothetical protein EB015_12930, partial [Methylocystaceae bacterium]|nr:hypothetical protein [Methylocystaceae bacterium]
MSMKLVSLLKRMQMFNVIVREMALSRVSQNLSFETLIKTKIQTIFRSIIILRINAMRLRELMSLKFNSPAIAALFAASCLLVGQANAQSYLSPGYIMGEIRDGLGIVKPEPA